MKKSILLRSILFVLLTSTLMVACYRDNDDIDDDNGDRNTVYMKNSVFSKTSLQIAAGSTVIWVNNDNTIHTVTANDGSFNSGDMAPGATYTRTFTSVGTYAYHCMHHTQMTATVIVVGSTTGGGGGY